MAFKDERHFNQGVISTASESVLVGPIDLSHYENFTMQFQNDTTAAFASLHVQASIDPATRTAGLAPNWVDVNTATIPSPSALGRTASVITSSINNSLKWYRVVGHISATTTNGAGVFALKIAGHLRR